MPSIDHLGPALALATAALIAGALGFDYLRNQLTRGLPALFVPGAVAGAVLAGALLSAWHNRNGEPLVWLFGSETVDFGLSEFGVVGALAACCILLLRLALRETEWGRWVLGLAAAAVFVIAGEELSWGQWIFHWSTPEPLAAVNLQQETNVHNLVDPRLYDIVYSAAGFALLFASGFLYFFGRLVWTGEGFLSRMTRLGWAWLRGSRAGLVLTLSAGVLLQHELFEEYSEFVLALAALLFLVHALREMPRAIEGRAVHAA